ncbi:hypothetical protein [Streptomyces clavifer]|uniref:hypothetical protein n=1 Tax=Streptomyces clavifer TaxID=68188 RepID=UPI0023815D19|nr:hypothetical protein [Streptomyces clavifer]
MRHSIDTCKTIQQGGDFLVDTCIFENQTGYKCHKPAIDATKQKTLAFTPTNQNLAFKKKIGYQCHPNWQ